jgi:hypothetical protein
MNLLFDTGTTPTARAFMIARGEFRAFFIVRGEIAVCRIIRFGLGFGRFRRVGCFAFFVDVDVGILGFGLGCC